MDAAALERHVTAILALSHLKGMNAPAARRLLERLQGDASSFFDLPASVLATRFGARSPMFEAAPRATAMADAGREMKFIEANDIRPLTFDRPDLGYPARLAEVEDAPVALSALGPFDLNDPGPFVAIVGTRHATAYGASFVRSLVEAMAASMVHRPVIVSGLAYGIDAEAHRAALRAGLPTVAVLAHGLNTIYPAAHRNLAAEIINSGGALVTEYWSSDAVHRGNFLARNRIVAGLVDCVVVVESDLKGGAMATARIAGDYGRDVYALPGRVTDRYSRGCNRLIATQRAALLADATALPEAMGWPLKEAGAVQQELFLELTPQEREIVDLLAHDGDLRLAEIKMHVDADMGALMARLVDMEFNGLIEAVPGGRYRLRRPV